MTVKRIVNSVFSSNTFILSEEGRAVIVDVGDSGPLMEYLEQNALLPVAVLLTHTHYDHIYGLKKLMEVFPEMPVYTSLFGKLALNKSNWNFSRYHEDEIFIESDSVKAVADGDSLPLFVSEEAKVIETPGHDKSSLSFKIGNRLFTGDSYIPGVKVIASFPNSNREEARSWYEKLKDMSRGMELYPGHGECFPALPT